VQIEVPSARAQDLLDSIFRVATTLVRGDRASLMLRAENSTDFVIARAIGLAREGDVVLLAGKGHEGSMLYGADRRSWDEVDAARDALRDAGWSDA